MTAQLELLSPCHEVKPAHIIARDEAMKAVAANAGKVFREKASKQVLKHLQAYGPTSGEDLTSACKAAGIIAHDDRAMGPIFHSLARHGLIAKAGLVERRRGHGSPGFVWKRA